jgi:HAD superfamily hydrolase (TIGR01459 family)
MAPGTVVLLISRDGETELLDDLDLVGITEGDHAELVILAGIRPEETSREAYQMRLRSYAQRGTTLLLVNPDTLISHGESVFFGPGAVAADYKASGGHVIPLGKPSKHMFNAALRQLNLGEPEKVLMIGDSPDHDIGGAKAVGMQTLLIRGGVQSSLSGASADFVMSTLNW